MPNWMHGSLASSFVAKTNNGMTSMCNSSMSQSKQKYDLDLKKSVNSSTVLYSFFHACTIASAIKRP